MNELSITSSTFTLPILEIIEGNVPFNEFFSLVFFFGGVSYYCGVFVDILRGRP